MSVRDRVDLAPRRVALYAVLLGLVAFYLAPLEAGVMTAFKTTDAFRETLPFVPPGLDGLTVGPWEIALSELRGSLVNSALLAIPATLLSATLGSLAAYGMTHMEWRGQLAVVATTVAGIFIPYQAVLVPLSRFWSIVDLRELLAPVWALPLLQPYHADILALVITHTAYGIPITTLLFRAYYQGFSAEMLEAARLDGASRLSIYRNIVLPLSKPMFAVTLIYQFTQIWNDLLFALVIIPAGSGESAVATMALNSLTGGIVTSFNTQMAGAFIAAFPTLLVYVLFGDKFAKGVAGDV